MPPTASAPGGGLQHGHRVGHCPARPATLLPIVGVRASLAGQPAPAPARRRDGHAQHAGQRPLRTLADSQIFFFAPQPCDGLADVIEQDDAAHPDAVPSQYTAALGPFGTEPGQSTRWFWAAPTIPLRRRCCAAWGPRGCTCWIPVTRGAADAQRPLCCNGLLAACESGRLTYRSTGDPCGQLDRRARWLDVRQTPERLPPARHGHAGRPPSSTAQAPRTNSSAVDKMAGAVVAPVAQVMAP